MAAAVTTPLAICVLFFALAVFAQRASATAAKERGVKPGGLQQAEAAKLKANRSGE
jgi:hypothetical protein